MAGINPRVYEKSLLDRVKDYAASVMVRDTHWLSLLMNDIIMELERRPSNPDPAN